jgi:PAS domain S-box-containing protein
LIEKKPTYDELVERIKYLEHEAEKNRQMIETLKIDEESYRFLVEDARDIIYKANSEGCLTFVNHSAIQETGYSERELIGKHYLDLIHPVHREGVEMFYLTQFTDQIPNTYLEAPIITKEGKVIWLGQHVQLMRKEDMIVGFHAVARDITKQKEAEDELEEMNERLETILDMIPLGIMIINPETHQIVDANPRALIMIGAPLESGKVCHNYICPAELGKCPITDLGQSVDDSDRVLLTSSGEELPVHKTVIPVLINGHNFLIECFLDLREQKRAENERIQNEKLQSIIEMAGAVCHEFNQPLQIIQGFSELLMTELEQSEELRGSAVKIQKQAKRMGEITRKLMAMIKYETKEYILGSKIIDFDGAGRTQ